MKTREQERSSEVYAVLKNRFGEDSAKWHRDTGAEKYLGTLKKTTARIYISGLGQAIAFVCARHDAQSTERQAVNELSDLVLVMMGLPGLARSNGETPSGALLRVIREGELETMMRATDEALAAITWLTRYLEGADVKSDDTSGADRGGGGQ
jgi:CRISPR/Cas system CMR-associated protein Cmr5 small subunit